VKLKRTDRSVFGRYTLLIKYRGGPLDGTWAQSGGTWYGRGRWPARRTELAFRTPPGPGPEDQGDPYSVDYADSGEYDHDGRRIYDYAGESPPWFCPACGQEVPDKQVWTGRMPPRRPDARSIGSAR
jgi:hypothetical protein